MSWCDIILRWRCPNCHLINFVNMTHQIIYGLEGIEHKKFVKEKCKRCHNEYYIDDKPPLGQIKTFISEQDCINDVIPECVFAADDKYTVKYRGATS